MPSNSLQPNNNIAKILTQYNTLHKMTNRAIWYLKTDRVANHLLIGNKLMRPHEREFGAAHLVSSMDILMNSLRLTYDNVARVSYGNINPDDSENDNFSENRVFILDSLNLEENNYELRLSNMLNAVIKAKLNEGDNNKIITIPILFGAHVMSLTYDVKTNKFVFFSDHKNYKINDPRVENIINLFKNNLKEDLPQIPDATTQEEVYDFNQLTCGDSVFGFARYLCQYTSIGNGIKAFKNDLKHMERIYGMQNFRERVNAGNIKIRDYALHFYEVYTLAIIYSLENQSGQQVPLLNDSSNLKLIEYGKMKGYDELKDILNSTRFKNFVRSKISTRCLKEETKRGHFQVREESVQKELEIFNHNRNLLLSDNTNEQLLIQTETNARVEEETRKQVEAKAKIDAKAATTTPSPKPRTKQQPAKQLIKNTPVDEICKFVERFNNEDDVIYQNALNEVRQHRNETTNKFADFIIDKRENKPIPDEAFVGIGALCNIVGEGEEKALKIDKIFAAKELQRFRKTQDKKHGPEDYPLKNQQDLEGKKITEIYDSQQKRWLKMSEILNSTNGINDLIKIFNNFDDVRMKVEVLGEIVCDKKLFITNKCERALASGDERLTNGNDEIKATSYHPNTHGISEEFLKTLQIDKPKTTSL